jgi:cyclin-dependent kinase regulatory subunit CKS1
MLAFLAKKTLLTETEWRNLGIVQSHGWEHYMVHEPEPHVLLFKREKDYLEKFGNNPRPSSSNVF